MISEWIQYLLIYWTQMEAQPLGNLHRPRNKYIIAKGSFPIINHCTQSAILHDSSPRWEISITGAIPGNPFRSLKKVFCYHPVFSVRRDLTFSPMHEKQTCVKTTYRMHGENNKRSILTMPIVNCVALVVW